MDMWFNWMAVSHQPLAISQNIKTPTDKLIADG
jgi:hypothetical protein